MKKKLRLIAWTIATITVIGVTVVIPQIQQIDEAMVKARIDELSDSYGDVPSSISCKVPARQAEKIICSDPLLRLMEKLDTMASIYAVENATHQEIPHNRNSVLKWSSIMKIRELTSADSIRTAYIESTNDRLGGYSPYYIADRKVPQQESQSTSPLVSFDVSQATLPENFNGINAKLLFEKLKEIGTQFKKDEYETEAEFKNRTAGIGDTKLGANLRLNSTIAFAMKVEDTFDAETSLLVTKPFLYNSGTVYLENIDTPVRTYLAQNRYGATVEVRVIQRASFRLEITNRQKFDSEDAFFRLRLDASQAKALRGRLATLLIGILAKPYIKEEHFTVEPTASRPQETFYRGNYFRFELREVWLYDLMSGKVYIKTVAK